SGRKRLSVEPTNSGPALNETLVAPASPTNQITERKPIVSTNPPGPDNGSSTPGPTVSSQNHDPAVSPLRPTVGPLTALARETAATPEPNVASAPIPDSKPPTPLVAVATSRTASTFAQSAMSEMRGFWIGCVATIALVFAAMFLFRRGQQPQPVSLITRSLDQSDRL
ncbi:MAG TPA: hypothetical protein VLT36_14275, partial [Candidatus Dormibacteraeota bacterium]|nr:hypothetical protein [Candidatus Dormibacteraeota bacterium]